MGYCLLSQRTYCLRVQTLLDVIRVFVIRAMTDFQRSSGLTNRRGQKEENEADI